MMEEEPVYLDYNATTPIAQEVRICSASLLKIYIL